MNNRKVKVHDGNGEFKESQWRHLKVGDVVKVEKDEFFPADILLLSSSYEDAVFYVETMNLDGETNNVDKNNSWLINLGNESKVPTGSDFECGNQITDIDGNIYNTVLIGSQCWMKENLNVGSMIVGASSCKALNTDHKL